MYLHFPSAADAREQHLFDGLKRTVLAGGGMVLDTAAPGHRSLGISLGPCVPAVTGFPVLCASPAVAAVVYGGLPYIPVIDPTLYGICPDKTPWLDWHSQDYRIYTVVPPHEVGTVYPLVKSFLGEFSHKHRVSLTIRGTGDRKPIADAVAFAVSESGQPKGEQGRIRINCGPWAAWEQAALATWGDCCLLPWAGCDVPLEALYGLGAGNFVAATGWSAGGVLTRRCGTLLDYTLEDGPQGLSAAVDWSQVQSIIRLAVANGRRERRPALDAAKAAFCENSGFLKEIMAKLDAPVDLESRGISCASSSPAFTLTACGRLSLPSKATNAFPPAGKAVRIGSSKPTR